MKYYLLYNLEELTKEKLLSGFLKDDYKIIYNNENIILVKKNSEKIIDEETYIKIVISIIKKYKILNKRGHTIDLSKAFEYAEKTKDKKYNILSNKFTLLVRQAIVQELIKWGDYGENN